MWIRRRDDRGELPSLSAHHRIAKESSLNSSLLTRQLSKPSSVSTRDIIHTHDFSVPDSPVSQFLGDPRASKSLEYLDRSRASLAGCIKSSPGFACSGYLGPKVTRNGTRPARGRCGKSRASWTSPSSPCSGRRPCPSRSSTWCSWC